MANVMVIHAGLRKNIRKKYTTNSFILNLAVADLGVIAFFIPIQITEYTVGLDVSDWTCKYIIPVRETFVIISIVTVADLGMVRFLQIHSSYVLSKRATYFIIGITWFLGYFAISMPLSFVIRHTDAMTCDHFWEDKSKERIHISILNTIQFIPLLVTTVCYLSIIRKVRSLRHREQSSRGTNEFVHRSYELSILMLMLIITAWWSLGPFLVYSLLSILDVPIEFPLKFWSTITVFLTSSSAINPVLVLLMNKDYRDEIQSSLFKREIATSTAATGTSKTSGKATRPNGQMS